MKTLKRSKDDDDAPRADDYDRTVRELHFEIKGTVRLNLIFSFLCVLR